MTVTIVFAFVFMVFLLNPFQLREHKAPVAFFHLVGTERGTIADLPRGFSRCKVLFHIFINRADRLPYILTGKGFLPSPTRKPNLNQSARQIDKQHDRQIRSQ